MDHAYERGGALAYLAAWDVRHARVFGRCEARTGNAAFDRLVAWPTLIPVFTPIHASWLSIGLLWLAARGVSSASERLRARARR